MDQATNRTSFPAPESFRDSVRQQFKLGKYKMANDTQIGGEHYKKAIQPWDAMECWMSPEQFEGFLRGNVIKYIARYKDKDGMKDVQKAKHYLEKLLECLEARCGTRKE